jgi:hypothetical protein
MCFILWGLEGFESGTGTYSYSYLTLFVCDYCCSIGGVLLGLLRFLTACLAKKLCTPFWFLEDELPILEMLPWLLGLQCPALPLILFETVNFFFTVELVVLFPLNSGEEGEEFLGFFSLSSCSSYDFFRRSIFLLLIPFSLLSHFCWEVVWRLNGFS